MKRRLLLSPRRRRGKPHHRENPRGFSSKQKAQFRTETTQLRAVRQGPQIVIATPGRLCDFLDRKLIQLSNAGLVVLDEADRMPDMGFLPALKQILKHVPERRQQLLFSAAIEKSVAHLISA